MLKTDTSRRLTLCLPLFALLVAFGLLLAPCGAALAVTTGPVAGITVDPASGLETGEDGTTATFTVVLDAAPTFGGNVYLTVASTDPTEGVASPALLTFTPSDWDTPQAVTVTGFNDNMVDGDVTYSVTVSVGPNTDNVPSDTSYSEVAPVSVELTNIDVGAPVVLLGPVSGDTAEDGTAATFEVVLGQEPTADVFVGLSSSDLSEGTVAPASLTFTSSDWDAPQTVTVTGVDDAEADGDVEFTIVTAVTVSGDPAYDGRNPGDVTVVNRDDETAAIRVSAISGDTAEDGTAATFTVVLSKAPVCDPVPVNMSARAPQRLQAHPGCVVEIPLSVSDTTEGDLGDVTSLTFSDADWNVPQTVTVTGLDDAEVDGDVAYTVDLGPASADDPDYNDLDPDDVAVTNLDDEANPVVITPLSLTVGEDGTSATFTVVLTESPAIRLDLNLSSSDPAEGTVSPEVLIFSTGNWNRPQTVTVTGVDDFEVDGDVAFTVVTEPLVAPFGQFVTEPLADFDPLDVTVTNLDDDVPGIVVGEISGDTTEDGVTAEFTVVLKVAPTAAVTIDVSSSDLSEGTVDVSQLTFTSDDWDIPKTVIVTGVDDALSDGKRVYTIVLDPGGSTDVVYAAIDPAEVAVNNLDNEPFPGITVGALSGDTSEGGTSATFTVVLDTEPSAEVTVAVTSLDTSEGTVDVPSLTFTPENWDTPREVTVTGVDDTFKDGDVTYDVRLDPAVSDDNAYAGIDPDDVSVTNADDEVAGVTLGNGTFGIIADASGEGSEPGSAVRLTFLNNAWGTTENPFLGTDFTVVLDSAPTADVTITIASSDPTEGTVLPTELTFTPGNGTVPQTVTVTGVDDDVRDGDVTYTLTLTAASGDANYDNLFLPDVTVTNQDNELSGVTLTPITGDTGEDGTTATFTVALDTAPTEPVTIGVTSSDTTEGTVSPEELTFTAADWSTSQTVTVTGADDAIADGDVAYTIILAPAVSMDPAYGGIDPADVLVTNVDDEAPGLMPGISVGAISGDTSEEGATATFTVVLDTAPSEDVTIGVTSNDLTEGTVDKATLTFTSSNWDTPQTVTVTGVADALDDGNIDYKVILAPAVSLDAAYAGIDPADVGLTNRDAAAELITVGPVSGDTAEDGTQATFTVVLGQAPTADVSIALSSSDLSEGIVSPAELTFTPANWETPQTVTVTGVDDTVDDGDVAFTIVTAPAVSADTAFSGRDTADVELANVDDEIIEIVASAVSGDTKEDGTTATFTVVLGTTPTAEVTVAVSSSDTSEGTVLPASLTFTPTNALTPQTVTVTGVDDTVDDDDTAYTVVLAAASSSDTDYNTLDPDDVAVTNLDDDTAGITVGAVSGDTAEDGTTATFTVVLDTVPTANVTVAVSSSNTAEGTVSPTSLIFTPANALSPQTLTVTGADDDLDDGDVDYTVVLAAAVSTDGKYNTVDPADVPATNLDDDETPVVTAAQSFSVAENSAATTSVGTAAATDGDAGTTFQAWTITTNANPDGDADLAFAIDPATGAITVNDAGDLDRETNASLTVSVTVSDGANTSAPETLTVNITDVNDVAPEVTAAQTFTVPENSPQATAVGTAAATDGDTSPTTFQGWAITVNPNPDGDSDLAFAIDPATGAITVNDPGDLDYESNPSLTVSLTVSDGVNTSAAQTAVVNLTEVNDAPTIDSAVPAAATENVEYSYTPAVTDPDGPGATWSVLAADTCGGAFAAGIYAFTPGDDPPADCVVSVQVCDGGTPEECAEQSAAVTITAVNDAPIIGSAVPAAATENVEYSYTPAVTDPDGPGANWSVLGDDTCGGAFAAGSYAFTPGDDPAADCLVSIRVCDGGTPEECAEQSGAVTITAVNDAPTIDSAPPAAATENVEYSYTPAVTDPDGPGTTWSVLAADTCGGAFAAGSYAFTPGDAPATDCLVSIRVCDGGTPEECGEQSGTVTITAVNDAPVATDDGISIREDNSITFSPLGNDFDVDGDVLTIVAVTNPAHGRVTDNGNRTVTYTPAPNYNGSDTFSYTISDGKATDSATVSITVAAVNDPPVITGQNAAFTVPQGGSFTFDISDLDVVDPDDTVFTLGVRPGLHYTVNGNTVTAANSYFGTLRVSVAVHDGTTASSPFEVIVTVVDGNPPTVAADPAGGVFKDEVSVVLTAEDNEDPNPTITYSLDGGAPTTPYGAALTIEESLTLRYAAEDADGNRSDTQEAVFTIDTDSPVIVLSTLVGVVTTEEVLNVSGIVTDDVGVKSLTVNGETVPVGTGGSFSTAVALKVGANEVIVVATDAVDRATTETFSVSRDTGAPKLAVTAPADGSVVDGATLTVTGTADAGATVSVALNGGDPLLAERDGEAFAASVTLKPGLNTIGVVAVAGDKASVAKRTVTLGENQLSLTITEPAQDRIAYGKNLALKGVFDSPDPASVAIALGEETFTPALNGEGAFTQALTFAEKGTYAVVVTGTDASGETVSAVRNVIFDPPPLGDIDGNGQLTTWDLILISKFILGVDTLTERQKVAADVNDDGVITTLDMIIIRKVILGIDPPFDS